MHALLNFTDLTVFLLTKRRNQHDEWQKLCQFTRKTAVKITHNIVAMIVEIAFDRQTHR